MADADAFGGSGGIIKVIPRQAPTVSVGDRFVDPRDLAVDPRMPGRLIVPTIRGHISSSGSTWPTGAQSIEAASAPVIGEFFPAAQGVATRPLGGPLFTDDVVLDPADISALPGVFALSTGSGASSYRLLTAGNSLVHPRGITVDEGTIYLADPDALGGTGAIFLVPDSPSGNTPPALISSGGSFSDPTGIDAVRKARPPRVRRCGHHRAEHPARHRLGRGRR